MREERYAALFALLETMKGDAGFKTCSRKMRLLTEVTAPEMPALFMSVTRQPIKQKVNFPARRSLGAMVFLYVSNPNPATPASTRLNNLLDLLDATLGTEDNLQTLGGLVEHAWIEGTIEIWEGPPP